MKGAHCECSVINFYGKRSFIMKKQFAAIMLILAIGGLFSQTQAKFELDAFNYSQAVRDCKYACRANHHSFSPARAICYDGCDTKVV